MLSFSISAGRKGGTALFERVRRNNRFTQMHREQEDQLPTHRTP
jgi:hypothetical protein